MIDLEYEKKMVEFANQRIGDLDGYDCKSCLNRGYFTHLDKRGHQFTTECSCVEIRKVDNYFKKSGLDERMLSLTFENFKVVKAWQKVIKEKALSFVKQEQGTFFIGGQVGTGKTHICSAITQTIMRKGNAGEYMQWRELMKKIKSVKNTFEEEILMIKLYKVKVLYLDDFLKVQSNKEVTQSDAQIAFDIIDGRYKRGLYTIISTEHTLQDINRIDPAVSSRIHEMSNDFVIEISKDNQKNVRENKELKNIIKL